MTNTLALIFAVAVGACIGSFLNVCIARWPQRLSVISPRSRCPKCERPIRSYENIPILGWIFLGGRCAGCRARISVQYPAVEILIAIVWGAAVWQYGPGFTALRMAVFVTLLAGIAITDAKHYLIPDGFTLFGMGWVLGTAFIALFVPQPSAFAGPYDALIGACTGAGAIAIAGWLGEVALGREAMGFGDVTLMAVVGAAIGPNRALLTIFIAAVLGVVVFLGVIYPITRIKTARRGEAAELPLVPFGVFLAPAAFLALVFGDAVIQWYLHRVLAF